MNEEITEFKKELLSKNGDEEEYQVTCRYKGRKLNSKLFISEKAWREAPTVDDYLKTICLDIAKENYEVESGVMFSSDDMSRIRKYWETGKMPDFKEITVHYVQDGSISREEVTGEISKLDLSCLGKTGNEFFLKKCGSCSNIIMHSTDFGFCGWCGKELSVPPCEQIKTMLYRSPVQGGAND